MTKRNYKTGIDRQQAFLLPPILDEYVGADNPVRAIDAYVDSLDLAVLGFQNAAGELTPGQPAFPPAPLLKLYLYGYLHRIRSSRRMAGECQRNLEVIWLVQGLQPGYKTIADFRKHNLTALQAVNHDFVQVCKELDLFGGQLVGIDGSFFRGNVAKKSIFTTERLQRVLQAIEEDIAQYLQELEQADQQEGEPAQADPALTEKLAQLRARQKKRSEQLEQLETRGETQIAEVDEDARLLYKKGTGTVAGYNVQTGVDEKYKLLLCGEVVQDGNDQEQLWPMSQAAKAELGVAELSTVEDLGYFNAQQIKTCLENGITPFVPEPDKQAQVRQQGRFPREDFAYDPQTNSYRCPGGQEVPFYGSREKGGKILWDYRSNPSLCAECPLQSQCLPKKTPYRTLTRWEHEAVIEAHRLRMAEKGKEKMRQRAALCEHPFGTLKVWLGWTHFLLRGLEKVRAEFSLMRLAYNFRRVLSIEKLQKFIAHCRNRRLPNPGLSG
jgi:transposase